MAITAVFNKIIRKYVGFGASAAASYNWLNTWIFKTTPFCGSSDSTARGAVRRGRREGIFVLMFVGGLNSNHSLVFVMRIVYVRIIPFRRVRLIIYIYINYRNQLTGSVNQPLRLTSVNIFLDTVQDDGYLFPSDNDRNTAITCIYYSHAYRFSGEKNRIRTRDTIIIISCTVSGIKWLFFSNCMENADSETKTEFCEQLV